MCVMVVHYDNEMYAFRWATHDFTQGDGKWYMLHEQQKRVFTLRSSHTPHDSRITAFLPHVSAVHGHYRTFTLIAASAMICAST